VAPSAGAAGPLLASASDLTSRPPRSASDLAVQLGLEIGDLTLLSEALVHSSYPNENPGVPAIANERLEFLGDSVVDLVISEELALRYPADDEGMLTARRAAIVSARGLTRIAQRIDLGAYLRLGQGAERAGARRRSSVLSAALEAVAGAIYLTLGLEAVRTVMLRLAAPELSAVHGEATLKSPKSQLQERLYASHGHAPEYRLVSASGPDHAKHYIVEAVIAGDVLGVGEGPNRREAETAAAAIALTRLDEAVPDAAASVTNGSRE
jgi:ribonuclease-3